jgi:Flp pilus assembly protein TadG
VVRQAEVPASARFREDSGVSTVEVAFLAPLMIAMIAIIVGLGIMVDTHGVVNEAARDAARAGSLQSDTSGSTDWSRDHTAARAQALAAAQADLGTRCGGKTLADDGDLTTTYIPAGGPPGPGLTGIAYYKVTITCTTSPDVLGLFGDKVLTASFSAPVNTYQTNTGVAP